MSSSDDYKPLWFCVRYPESNEWKLFDSSAKLAGFKSGKEAADKLGAWQWDYSFGSDQMDTIRRGRARHESNQTQER